MFPLKRKRANVISHVQIWWIRKLQRYWKVLNCFMKNPKLKPISLVSSLSITTLISSFPIHHKFIIVNRKLITYVSTYIATQYNLFSGSISSTMHFFIHHNKLYKKNEAEINKKYKNKLGTFWGCEFHKQKLEIKTIYISFENLHKNDCPEHCHLLWCNTMFHRRM